MARKLYRGATSARKFFSAVIDLVAAFITLPTNPDMVIGSQGPKRA
ncbi:MAG TPA: hypothetical protein VG711_05475 [Phycisphaerales bacterium]|nr:hypothetical protein [Phycisphaerales bacterium]